VIEKKETHRGNKNSSREQHKANGLVMPSCARDALEQPLPRSRERSLASDEAISKLTSIHGICGGAPTSAPGYQQEAYSDVKFKSRSIGIISLTSAAGVLN